MTTPTLPDLQAAARMALDALEARCGTNAEERKPDGAITTLRAALSVAPFDVEAMLTACVPGGTSCDPQHVADAIRAYCAAPAAPNATTRGGWFLDCGQSNIGVLWEQVERGTDGAVWLSADAAPVGDVQPSWRDPATLPKDDGSYLICDAERGHVAPMVRGIIHNNPGTTHDWQWGAKVTGWMPLPLPVLPTVAQQAAEPTEAQIALLDPWMRPAAARELLRQVLAVAPAAHAQQQAAPLGECDECGTPYSPDPTDGGSICVRCVRETLGRLHAQQQAAEQPSTCGLTECDGKPMCPRCKHQQKLDAAAHTQPPALVADAAIKAMYVEMHGSDRGWLGVEGSYFISGVQAARTAQQQAADYEAVLADHRRLVRELDVLLNGDGAAPQASLCDLVSQVAAQQQAATVQPLTPGQLEALARDAFTDGYSSRSTYNDMDTSDMNEEWERQRAGILRAHGITATQQAPTDTAKD